MCLSSYRSWKSTNQKARNWSVIVKITLGSGIGMVSRALTVSTFLRTHSGAESSLGPRPLWSRAAMCIFPIVLPVQRRPRISCEIHDHWSYHLPLFLLLLSLRWLSLLLLIRQWKLTLQDRKIGPSMKCRLPLDTLVFHEQSATSLWRHFRTALTAFPPNFRKYILPTFLKRNV